MEKSGTKELTDKQIQDILSDFVEAKEKRGPRNSKKIGFYDEYPMGAVQLSTSVLKRLREARTKKTKLF